MLAGVILGGAYLYKYFALQVSRRMYLNFFTTFIYLLIGEGTWPEDSLGSQFSPVTAWFLEVGFRVLALVASTFTH